VTLFVVIHRRIHFLTSSHVRTILLLQAEVNRLMDIIVHSLYSNKDIFLRELVSNGADALDKVRFSSITEKSVLGEGDAAALPFEIKISADKERRVLSIRDTGIGMTKEDLVNNLGTIARSGTAAFIEQAQKGGDINLIGQFGVGFYSVYLISDYVEVITKHASDKQWVWESTASGTFAVSEDTEGERLGRGTLINIHVKEGAEEYLEESKLRELVQRYSEFINFPISLLIEKTVEKEVPVEDATPDSDKDDINAEKRSGGDGDVAVEEEEPEDEEGASPKTKKVSETVREWEVLNDAKALWLRQPADINDEEYEGFYKSLTRNEKEKPLAHSHFRAEGDVDFKAVLYLPSSAPPDMFDQYYTKSPRVKLYVRRVLVSESFEELLPKWLSFLVGLVDSDTMPINVSREMLQMSEGIKVIRKKLVRKALDMIKQLSDAEIKAKAGEDVAEGKGWLGSITGKNAETESTAKKEAIDKYATFWKTFGKAVKMGVIEDMANRRRLLPFLRFQSTASGGNETTLEDYVARMKPNQTEIYFLVGTSGIEELKRSPFVEALVSRGYEVILFTDPLEEYMMGNLSSFEEKKFVDVSKGEVNLSEGDAEEQKKIQRRANEYYKGVASWWRGVIADSSVSAVKVSKRLASAPCVVASGKWGWSATMERIAKAQALGSQSNTEFMRSKRTLEINPRHPLIRELRSRWVADPEDPALAANAKLLYETCLMESGFMLDDVKSHNDRILALLGSDMSVSDLTPATEDEEYPEVAEPSKPKPTSDNDPSEPVLGGSNQPDEETKEELMAQVRNIQIENAEKEAMKDEL